MIKRIITAAFALSAIAGVAQAADTASGNISLSATVGNTCYIKELTSITLNGATWTDAKNGANLASTLSLPATAVSADTAIAQATSYTLGINAYCNYADHSIGLRSQNGGLTRNAAITVEGAFAKRIGYNATLSKWGEAKLNTLAAVGDFATNDAVEKKESLIVNYAVNATAAELKIDTLAGTNPLVEGTYSDVLTLRLGAAF